MTYYDTSYPPSLWETPPTVPATGAVAGSPGTWTPDGSTAPASVADLIAGTPEAVTASPATAWTTGQYVQTQTIGVGGRAYWNGTAWIAGMAAFDVNTSTIAVTQEYVNAHPDEADEILATEQANQNRVTLVTWLENFIAERDASP